jgi:UDP-2-acetamido-3-amino-2,3-dideoxy-glucuronate N-acetyltransferase
MTTHAIIATNANIASDAIIGEYCVIRDNVTIAGGTEIGPHVVIHEGSRIGANVRIGDHSVVGKNRLRAARSILKDDNYPPAVIGDGCLLGAHVTIYCGAELAKSCLVADLATVREQVSIGEETIVGRNVVVENQTTVGRKCKLETNCYITAYSVIEDFCFIAPMVATSNDNYVGRTEERKKHFKGITVKRGGRIGVGAVILPGVTIGEDALVGAGATVLHDVPPRKIVVGCPARVLRDVPEEQLLENQGWE